MKLRIVIVLFLILLVAVAAWFWYSNRGVTHHDLRNAISDESAAVQQRVDERYRQLDAKLDRIESKLDRLLDLATPKLPDGMKAAQ